MKTIHQLHPNDKPREKLLAKGVQALKNYELMAILLGHGIKEKDIIKLSKEAIKHLEKNFESLKLESLIQIQGLGETKSMQILSAIELSKRYLIQQNKKVTSAKDVYAELKTYASKQQEYLLAITLNGASHIIQIRVITIGTLTQSLVHPREVFADAISDRAASIIIAHNHPSGELEASEEDKEVTKIIKNAGEILGIELLDHVIISKNGYFSFAENKLL